MLTKNDLDKIYYMIERIKMLEEAVNGVSIDKCCPV